MAKPELISEPITPFAGTSDVSAMARGEPGLPTGFAWRGQDFAIAQVLEKWKHSTPEGGTGEVYLRRHYFKLAMSDGAVWTIYFTRQTPRTGNPKKRWFLYTIDANQSDNDQSSAAEATT